MFQKILKLVFIKHIVPGPGRFVALKELAEELKELKKELTVEEVRDLYNFVGLF